MDIQVTRDDAGEAVLAVSGSIDLASKEALLETGLREMDRAGCRRLVLDLSQVGFIDSSGIGVLITLENDGRSRGIELSLREPSHRVTRVLALTGLGSRFGLHPEAGAEHG